MHIVKIKKTQTKNKTAKEWTHARQMPTYATHAQKRKNKKPKHIMSLEEIFNNFYYKILYSYPFIGDYYINTML